MWKTFSARPNNRLNNRPNNRPSNRPINRPNILSHLRTWFDIVPFLKLVSLLRLLCGAVRNFRDLCWHVSLLYITMQRRGRRLTAVSCFWRHPAVARAVNRDQHPRSTGLIPGLWPDDIAPPSNLGLSGLVLIESWDCLTWLLCYHKFRRGVVIRETYNLFYCTKERMRSLTLGWSNISVRNASRKAAMIQSRSQPKSML